MSKKDDLLRVLEYGRDPYYAAIKTQPTYQSTLQKIKDTRPEKNWIQSPFQLPKFSSDTFEKQRASYQAKYGSRINVPGFEDIIQYKLQTKISNEDMAAHVYAQKRGLPSPLSDEQLKALATKKLRFLKMLQAPEDWVNRAASSIMTATDNANDALFTFALLGQIATKVAPKALGRMAPVFGWAQGAADVLNLVNVAAQITKKSYAHKRMLEKNLDKNPFHAKFWSQRITRFGSKWPGLGELLQVPQVTQSMFGIGLCLGGIMGTMNDVLTVGTEQLLQGAANVIYTAEEPERFGEIWANTLNSASLVWNAKDWVDKQSLEEVTLAASYSMDALMPTWLNVESMQFLEVMKTAGQRQRPPRHIDTKYILDAFGIDPSAAAQWPMLDAFTAPMEEIAYTYGPRINDNFTTYLLENQNDPVAALVGEAAVNYHGSMITAFSDDHVAQVSNSAIAGAAKDMAIATLLFPPETSQATIEKLADWITQFERDHGSQPSTKDIEIKGIGLGIKWKRNYPQDLSGKAAELFPGWQAIQDQLGKIYTPGSE